MSPLIQVRARVASTHPNNKYPGHVFGPPVMEQMARELKKGLPMVFDHDPSHPVQARVISAEVVPLPDGHLAVETTFEVDQAEWQVIQDQFDAAGVAGGFSFTAAVPDRRSSSHGPAVVRIAADAAAWTDDEREEARARVDAVVPTDSALLFQLSAASDVATVFLILAQEVGISLLGDAVGDAIKRLVLQRAPAGRTRIEIHRTSPDGSSLKAVVVTDDEKVAMQALEKLPNDQTEPVIVFDSDAWDWPDRTKLEA